ncbi:MAG TPA: exosortase-associated EpsI family protein, partial [Candidatus Binatia bacterium]|nr:exosortase-associated EpsI family protein [Candidatus Binatia bacterium]
RVGNDVATGVIERQVIKLKYGLRGIIPDGALIRVSTTGLPVEAAYQIQDRFIRELLAEIAPENRRLLVGDGSGPLIRGLAKTLQ